MTERRKPGRQANPFPGLMRTMDRSDQIRFCSEILEDSSHPNFLDALKWAAGRMGKASPVFESFMTLLNTRAAVALLSVTPKQEGVMAAVVKLYRTDNGVSIATDATDERDFLAASAVALARAAQSPDDLGEFLPHVLEIACKMRGYKAPTVVEKRVLMSGPGALPEDALLVQANGRGIIQDEVVANQ